MTMTKPDNGELLIDATVENLTVVNEYVESILSGVECSMKTKMQIDLVVEEIFVNVASYAYEDGIGKATVGCRLLDNPLATEIVFKDEGIPYNPLENEAPDTNLPIEQRRIGGLGIFLVKKNVDFIDYEYKDGQNVLTIRKNLV